MNYIKNTLKNFLGIRLWSILVQLLIFVRNIWINLLSNMCIGILNSLRANEAAKVIERVRLIAPLDYAKSNINFKISTYGEYKRATRACSKEPGTIEWIESHLIPGDTFYDVGANVGAYSFVAYAHTGGNCRIYAFEPSYSTFASLCNNIYLNQCTKAIIPLQIALSNYTGLTSFKYSNVSPGAAFHSVGVSVEDQDPVWVAGWEEKDLIQRGLSGLNQQKGISYNPVLVQHVPSYRVDDVITNLGLPVPNHIKIDVDGSEFMVIDGARQTLAATELRSMLIEIDLESADRMKQYLNKAYGFKNIKTYPCGRDYASMVFIR